MESEEVVSLKHKNSDSESESPPKKQKWFSAKEFRKQLLTGDKITSVVNFLKAVKEDKHHDYIYDYLEAGGNCLELLQLLEQESTLNPCIVFELVTYVLLKINVRYPQHHISAIEACKYMIGTYVSLINKMINLSSTAIERKTALKLLTAIVTLSLNLAKDILINVNFNQTNLELLTKHTGQKDSVRDIFIHFLTAFLVDGHYPSLSILLEKRGILTSIIKDLQYDNCETVCLVITAMKNHILENPSVSKTAKMKTFSTPVVRDIVNLYNWKGPASFKSQKKDLKVKIDINEVEKSKVSACVHEFLLVLCTSHKNGVIFRDPSMGLGKKHQNSLMYTVLESLDRPWEHSYASQLVTKICKACPDLVKTMWANLKPYLELRPTKKWLNAVNFARSLLGELDGSCLEFCAGGLGQLARVVSYLVLPLPILKVVVTENFVYEHGVVRQHVVGLLLEFLRSTLKFSGFPLRKFLEGHVGRNFPDAYSVLNQWRSVEDCGEIPCLTLTEELNAIFDLFECYKKLSPGLLETLNNSTFNMQEFLLGLPDEKLQLKALNLFVDLDSVKFSPKTQLFGFVVPLALKFYHQNRDQHSLNVLQKLFRLTNIFDGFEAEINIWINPILDLKKFDDRVAETLVKTLRETSENFSKYVDDLNGLKKSEDFDLNYKEVIESLAQDKVDVRSGIKHKNISPFVIGLLDSVKDDVPPTNLTVYLTFATVTLYHSQTNANVLRDVLQRFKVLPNVVHYIDSDSFDTIPDFQTFKIFDKFRKDFLTGNVGNIDCVYPDLPLNLLQLAVFYVDKLCQRNELTDQHIDNFANLLKSNNKLDGDVILGNFNIYSQFSWGSPLIKLLCITVKVLGDNEQYLGAYRKKLVTSLSKIVRKPQKYQTIEGLTETLETFKLERQQCTDLLTKITNDDSVTIIEIVAYCLTRLADFDQINLDLTKLGNYFEFLLQNEREFDKISGSLLTILEKFPYLIQDLRPQFFNSLLSIQDYHKNNVQLCKFLLERNPDYLENIKENLDKICQKKFLILPLLKIITDNISDLELSDLYEKFEPTLTKALQKPQKAGQHFINNPEGLQKLLQKSTNAKFFDKVQKFDVSETFLAVIIRSFGENLLKNNTTEKQTSNLILTFIHLQLTIFKRKNLEKLDEIAEHFNAILDLINCDLPTIPPNDSFKLFCKFTLKYGITNHPILLTTLNKTIQILSENLDFTDVKIIFDMLTSHSEFLNVILEDTPTKLELLTLFSKIVGRWPVLMERAHIPVLLAAYRATLRKSDVVILGLLRKYEENGGQTQFQDFKPFLWDRAAVSHYSVRSSVENRLSRQPKMGDVLDILQEQHVRSTIKNYSIHQSLREPNLNVENETCYDLSFLLPLFSQLLAPENQVYTYKFARSGALSLTIVALSSSDEEVRKAACHVLSRFYFHMEARQSGKDNLLWVRFIEAVSKGTALLEGFRLNNFSAIYLSRMALILTQPTHVMYVPMSQYLAAKPSLDFSTVPELYTFLHSSDLNYREHRQFALELLRDGLRTEKDFTDFLRSMAFKLFSCLYTSTLADLDTKNEILDILISCCKIPLGCKILCENHSFLPQLRTMLLNDLKLAPKFLTAINWLTQTINDKFFTKEIYDMLTLILDQSEPTLHTVLLRIYKKYPQFFDDQIFQKLEEKSGDKLCKYMMKHGCRFINTNSVQETDLRLLFFTRKFLNQWRSVEDCGEIPCLTLTEELNAIFDLFECYKKLSPGLLETLNNSTFNMQEFLLGLPDEKLQLKALNLFVDLDSVKFSPKTQLFGFVVPLALKFYHQNRDQHSLNVLQKLFRLTNIFDGFEAEINIWINPILDLKKFHDRVAETLVKTLRETSENLVKYVDDLNGLKKSEDFDLNYKEVIESLAQDKVDVRSGIKHKNISPFVIGLLDSVKDEVGGNLTVYLTFATVTLYHSQTNVNVLWDGLQRFKVLPNVVHYIDSDSFDTIPDFQTFKIFDKFRKDFLTGNVGNIDCVYPDLPLNLLQLAVFYVDKLCQRNQLTDQHIDNFANLLKSNNKLDGDVILGNFNIYSQFSWGSPLIKLLCITVKVLGDNEQYLGAYRKKLVTSLSKIVRKPQKYQTIEGLTETLETFKLERQQCTDLLTKITNDDSVTIIEIVAYCLTRLADFDEINLDLTKLGNYFEFLLQNEREFDKISGSLLTILEKFPYLIQDIRPQFFNNLLSIQDYHKNNVQLCKFLLERNPDYLENIKENLDKICQKKFLILPLLKIITDNISDLELSDLYEKFEPTLTKALQKPQKAGQHFINNPEGLLKLLQKSTNAKSFDKVQRFDVSETFLAVIIRSFGENLLKNNPTEKQTSNLILTFIHLQLTIFKRKNLEKLDEIAGHFNAILDLINCDLPTIPPNDSFKLFCKFTLKYGITNHPILLTTLNKTIQILSNNLDFTDVKIIFDMLTSHSEFLNVILEDTPTKLELLTLFSKIVDRWPVLMERAHIPVLLAAYRATLRKSDVVILGLLRKYEENGGQTQFQDFKPFLWDRAAVSHYSVRSSVENRLSRQPKMGDVLDILQEQHVRSTIKNYSIHQSLREPNLNVDNETCYDLSFLLPLFSQLLAPENQVYTYKFARSGALSLTIVALSSSDEEVRKAACHVLSRFYFHMEARQSGKDNLLWVRFIEAVSKGTALLEGFRLNNFSAIYLSRMALILTQPTHVMYVPMSQYLAAKPSLDFSTVPELYTFLHSSDLNYREHRQFALELLRDGLRTEKDFTDFLRSMAFKLFSCLYTSTLADLDTKNEILDILISCCKIPLGCKVLCENHSFLPQLRTMLLNDLKLAPKFLTAINWLTQTINDKFFTKEIYDMLTLILDKSEPTLHTVLLRIYKKYPQFFDDQIFQKLEEKSGDKLCKYMMKHGCRFINTNSVQDTDLRLLFFTRFK